jgi:hypothetical protein
MKNILISIGIFLNFSCCAIDPFDDIGDNDAPQRVRSSKSLPELFRPQHESHNNLNPNHDFNITLPDRHHVSSNSVCMTNLNCLYPSILENEEETPNQENLLFLLYDAETAEQLYDNEEKDRQFIEELKRRSQLKEFIQKNCNILCKKDTEQVWEAYSSNKELSEDAKYAKLINRISIAGITTAMTSLSAASLEAIVNGLDTGTLIPLIYSPIILVISLPGYFITRKPTKIDNQKHTLFDYLKKNNYPTSQSPFTQQNA